MIIGDDSNLAGGGVDPREVFKTANVKPPAINPALIAGMVPPPPPGGVLSSGPPLTGGTSAPFVPPGPPNPLHRAMQYTQQAADDPYDISSIS
jgi:hypothetical protein